MLDLASWFKDFPPELATLLIATLPIGELRASIPIARGVYDLSISQSYIWSVLGNILPLIFLLWLLDPVSKYLIRNFKMFDRFFTWLFSRTRRKYAGRFEKWGALALITFVAIPLPVTGGWTGAVAAFVFGIPFKKALPLISIGVLIAGVIVILAVEGVITII